MVEPSLGVVVSVGGSLDAEVAEHGFGFSESEELDGILVQVDAEKGGGTAGAQGASGDVGRVNAGFGL